MPRHSTTASIHAQIRVLEKRAKKLEMSATKGLRAAGCTVHPSGANFLLFEQDGRPANDLHRALFGRGVLIRNVSSGRDLSRALRVSIGAPAANDAFLAALKAEL